jgi:branched-chain amino acid transport system permease protein
MNMLSFLAGIDFSDLIGVPLRGALSVSAIVFALGAIALNLHYGFTGLLNVGMVAFIGAGSYGLAISLTQGWAGGSLIFAMFIGLLLSVFIALLVGVPALRLRGDYLAIVTIAIGEVMRVAFRSQKLLDLTGGPFGLPRAEDRATVSLSDQIGQDWNPLYSADEARSFRLFWLDMLEFDAKTLWLMILGWLTVLLMTLLVWKLVNSPWGRVIKAIREDEDAARALGKNVFNYKLQSLIIGGMIGAVAGFYRTFDTGFVETLQLRPQTTFFIWTALILGGAASKWGPVVGAILFWFMLLFVEEFVRQIVENGWVPEWLIDSNDVGRIRLIMMGVMLAALMIWRPQGLLGKKEEALLDVR